MVFDPKLYKKIDNVASTKKNLSQTKMFGGVGFFSRGHVCFGVFKDYLILRLGPEGATKALSRKYTKPFDITGRAMKGWVMVAGKGIKSKATLSQWIDQALTFVSTLPRK